VNAREAMTPAPLTVTPRPSVAAALRLARDNRISHLPVVERGLILAVVRRERLLALTPSEATTLSRHEMHDAARLLLERGAHEALVTEADRLVGILTHSDLLRALVLDEPEAVA
jgi:CBS domain-containing protein